MLTCEIKLLQNFIYSGKFKNGLKQCIPGVVILHIRIKRASLN